jgi:hypothetical protein
MNWFDDLTFDQFVIFFLIRHKFLLITIYFVRLFVLFTLSKTAIDFYYNLQLMIIN